MPRKAPTLSGTSKPTDHWYNKLWIKITGVVTTIATLIAIGFGFGQKYAKNEAVLNEYIIRIDCQTQIQAERNNCQKATLEITKSYTDKYEKVMSKLEKNEN